ncbi:MAG: DUF5047 domain-containing protein [Chloroflexi bacterium]|nr:DUF5047 domain-containing protein [Chloroflexota bacterium]
MRGRSAKWDQAIGRSPGIVAAVEVIDTRGVVIASSYPGSSPRLAVGDGEVQVDRGANVRRSLSGLTIAGTDSRVLPLRAADILSVVSGNEIRPYRGIRYADGTEELMPLGIFGLADAPLEDAPDRFEVTLTGFDRSRRISRNRWDRVFQIVAGTNVIAAGQALLRDRMPGITFLTRTSTAHVTPELVFDESTQDPWAEAVKIFSSAGLEVYFDVDGNCVIAEEPDPNAPGATKVATYGEVTGMPILSISRATSNEQVYNGVIVTGESASNPTPVRAVAWDDDPASPTYYLGSYGKVPYFFTSQYIATEAQALAAARGRLKQVKSATEVITGRFIPNPAHEEVDIIEISRGRSGTSGLFVLDGFNIPLRASREMTLRTRKRYVPA